MSQIYEITVTVTEELCLTRTTQSVEGISITMIKSQKKYTAFLFQSSPEVFSCVSQY
jgi:hypothetical protein